jgi:copper(I)-binding protein
MEGDIMRMRDIAGGLDLPAGKTVELSPNGLHLMLTGLKQPLAAGTAVPLVLQFVDADGRKGTLAVQVPILQAPPAGGEEHHHHG